MKARQAGTGDQRPLGGLPLQEATRPAPEAINTRLSAGKWQNALSNYLNKDIPL
jgi:hypothetical protein